MGMRHRYQAEIADRIRQNAKDAVQQLTGNRVYKIVRREEITGHKRRRDRRQQHTADRRQETIGDGRQATAGDRRQQETSETRRQAAIVDRRQQLTGGNS
jgi:hypothetical protein